MRIVITLVITVLCCLQNGIGQSISINPNSGLQSASFNVTVTGTGVTWSSSSTRCVEFSDGTSTFNTKPIVGSSNTSTLSSILNIPSNANPSANYDIKVYTSRDGTCSGSFSVNCTDCFTVIGDMDADGIADGTDNCVNIANASQTDADMDNMGAACDCNDNVSGSINTAISSRDTTITSGQSVNLSSLIVGSQDMANLQYGTAFGNYSLGTTSTQSPTVTTTYFIRDSVNTVCVDTTMLIVTVENISVSPDTVLQSGSFNVTVTGTGVSWASSSTHCVEFTDGSSTLNFNVTVGHSNSNTLTGNLSVPANASISTNYDVRVYNANNGACSGTFDALCIDCFTVKGDMDSDGVADDVDNCVNIANANQTDADMDNMGAACDCNDNVSGSINTAISSRDTTITSGQSVNLSTLIEGSQNMANIQYGTAFGNYSLGTTSTQSPTVTTTYFIRDSVNTVCVDTTMLTVTVENISVSPDTVLQSGSFNVTVTGTGVSWASSSTHCVEFTDGSSTLNFNVTVGHSNSNTLTGNLSVPANASISTNYDVRVYNANNGACSGTFDALCIDCFTVKGDMDSDGVADDVDNCINIANANQTDADMDNIGAACDCNDNVSGSITTSISSRDTAICVGESIDLSLLIEGSQNTANLRYGTAYGDYSLGNLSTHSPTSTRVYYIRDSVNTVCVDTTVLTVTVNPLPSIVGRDTAICPGESVNLNSLVEGASSLANLEFGVEFGTYTLPSVMQSPGNTTTYFIRDSINATGCVDTAMITVTVNMQPAIEVRDTTLCRGETIDLNLLVKNASNVNNLEYGTVFGMYNLSNTMQAPSVTTTYFVRDSIDATGCLDNKQFTVNINPPPSITARDTAICAGEQINLSTLVQGITSINNLEYGTAFGAYSLPNGMQAPMVTTTYYIRDSLSAPSCLDTTQLTVTVKPATTKAMAGNDQLNICGTMVNISANMPSVGTGAWSASPSGGSFGNVNQSSTTFTGNIGTTYTLTWTITGECGNETDQLMVQFNPDSDNDTVQDCNDICPNGDDRVNTDGMGMPDACDCDPNNMNDEMMEVMGLIGGYILPGTYQSSFEITSSSDVQDGSLVQFKAGNTIVLQPGFYAEAGSEFIAKIELCNNPSLSGNSLIDKEVTALTGLNKIGKKVNKLDWQISPNPFNDALKVKATFSADQSIISLSVHDHLGRLVTTVIKNQAFSEGVYEWVIDGENIPTGINYLLIQTSEGPNVKKLIKVE